MHVNIPKKTLSRLLSCCFGVVALSSEIVHATPIKTEVIDGKTVTITAPNSNIYRLNCGNVSAVVNVHDTEDNKIQMMVTMGVRNGEHTTAYRLFDPFSEIIKSEISVNSMEVGCLTENGGLGFRFSSNGLKPSHYLQIDAKAHVFEKYNEAGLKIVEEDKSK